MYNNRKKISPFSLSWLSPFRTKNNKNYGVQKWATNPTMDEILHSKPPVSPLLYTFFVYYFYWIIESSPIVGFRFSFPLVRISFFVSLLWEFGFVSLFWELEFVFFLLSSKDLLCWWQFCVALNQTSNHLVKFFESNIVQIKNYQRSQGPLLFKSRIKYCSNHLGIRRL